MLRWLGHTLSSSIGKKALMAVTGLLLIGFLIEHVFGNLFLYAGEGPFDGYVALFKRLGPGLYVLEAGLFLLFAAHIYLGVRVSMENHEARSRGYHVRNTRGQATVSSTTMLITGLLVLAYLVKHIVDFRLNEHFEEAPFERVRELLSHPVHALVYVAAAIALTFHLAHALRSACQSLGLSHPKLTPLLERISVALALLIGLGFMSFPLYFWLFDGGSR
jgi:succinate dehydrogenase / fumarate reductase cytochrome b subunit